MSSRLSLDETGYLFPVRRFDRGWVQPSAPGLRLAGSVARCPAAGSRRCSGYARPGRPGSAIMPGMRSEPGHDQPADGRAAGGSRAGQSAVVTGGPAGLGLAIATALAQSGTDVVLASRPAARCARAAARLSASTDDDPQVRHFLAAGIRGRPGPPGAAGPPAEPPAATTETCHHLHAATRKPAEPGGPGRVRAPGSRAC